jgi:hypothetical protein
MGDLTAANVSFVITVPLLLPAPTTLSGFAADDIFDVDDVDATDVVMGVDGILSGGMIFAPKPMNIALQADSTVSIAFFDAWYQGQEANYAAYPAQAVITFTGINTSYLLTTGFLSRYKPMPDAKKMLQPRKFRVTWQTIIPTTVGSGG